MKVTRGPVSKLHRWFTCVAKYYFQATTPGSHIISVASGTRSCSTPSLGLSTSSCLARFPCEAVGISYIWGLQNTGGATPGLRKAGGLVPAWACGPPSLAGGA